MAHLMVEPVPVSVDERGIQGVKRSRERCDSLGYPQAQIVHICKNI